jgi:hypothetical protein
MEAETMEARRATPLAVPQAPTGDDAFAEAVAVHHRTLTRFAYMLCGNAAQAEEARGRSLDLIIPEQLRAPQRDVIAASVLVDTDAVIRPRPVIRSSPYDIPHTEAYRPPERRRKPRVTGCTARCTICTLVTPIRRFGTRGCRW